MNYTKSFSTVHTKHWECFIIQGKLNMSEIFKGFWEILIVCEHVQLGLEECEEFDSSN